MNLIEGNKLDEIILPSISGKEFNTNKLKGKKILLSFFRFATCPLCNLRIHEIVKNYNQFGKNFEIVIIFNSSELYLTKTMKKHNAPFTILADENFKYLKFFPKDIQPVFILN